MKILVILFAVLSLNLSAQIVYVPLEEKQGTYNLVAEINGFPVEFTFDPGAYITVINPSIASFLFKNGYLSNDNIIGTTKGSLADGSIKSGTKILIDRIVVGGLLLTDVEATILDGKNTSMLFGQSALKKVASYSVNNENLTLELTPFFNSDFKGECTEGDCENGFGKFVFFDGSYYEGEFVNDDYNGKGLFFWSDGDKFTGIFKDGLRDGKGEIFLKDGTKIEGNWVAGLKEGLFLSRFPNGKIFKEYYKNNDLITP